jgi:glucose/arabinose dehydrogenase
MRRPASSLSLLVLVSFAACASRPDHGDAQVQDNPAVPYDGGTEGTFCALPDPAPLPSSVTVPEGFCIRRFARVGHPRVLAFAPNGDLFVASPSSIGPGGTGPGLGAIVVFPDDNRDGVGDAPQQFLAGVDSVHGLLFDGASLYYTVQNGVFRTPYTVGSRRAVAAHGASERVADLSDSIRWTHTLARATDGSLYVSMGQHDSSTCPSPNPRAGAVLRIGPGMPPNGARVIDGLRNPMYLRCKEWGACYAAELTHDGWTQYGGVEKLVQIRQGDTYGFPCCIDRDRTWSGTPRGYDCGRVAESVQTYPLHDTPFGFDWAPSTWPAPYNGAFFVGLHGEVGSWRNTGVQWAPVDPTTHRPTRPTVFFVTNWGRNGGIQGRVADLVFAPDGRLFFSDDQDGAIYWIAPRSLRIPER